MMDHAIPNDVARADDRLVAIVRGVETMLRTRIYSHKYAIVFFVYHRPGAVSHEIQGYCRSASSTFYKCLKELQQANILTTTPSPADQRHQHYQLAPRARHLHDRRHRAIGRYFSGRIQRDETQCPGVIDSIRSIERELGLRYYSPEYEAIMFLYEQGHAPARAIRANSSSAGAAFYAMLKRLADIGTIDACRSSTDRREKWYALSDRATAILDEAHGRIIRSNLL